MSALTSVAPGALDWIARMALEIAVFVIAVLFVQRVLGRFLAPRWRYGLWLVVLARLLVPVSPESRFALPRLGLAGTERASVDTTASGPAPTATHPAGTLELFDEPDLGPGPVPGATPRLAPVRAAALAAAPAEPAGASGSWLGWKAGVLLAWLAGALGVLSVALVRECAFRRRLARDSRHAGPRGRALLEACRAEAGLARDVQLVATDLVSTPAVMGILAPRVLVPRRLLESASEEELRRFFRHELAHVRHADIVLAHFVLLARALWWFHPLVHLALARLSEEQELARDFEALAREPSPSPLAYAGTLVKVVEQSSAARAPVHAALLIGGGSDLQRRIHMITRFDGSLSRGRALALALVVLLGWGAFTSASSRAEHGSAASPPPSADPSSEALALSGPGSFDETRPDDVRTAQIVVERHQEPPAWLAAANQALATRVGPLTLSDAPLRAAVDFLAKLAHLEVSMSSDLENEFDGQRLNLAAGIVTIREGLDIVCDAFSGDLGWCIGESSIVVGYRSDLPYPDELRLYRVDPLLAGAEPDSLQQLIYDLVGHGQAWERDGASMQYWNGVLAIVQTAEIHAEVQSLLERLLARDGTPGTAAREDEALVSKLAEPTIASFSGYSLRGAAAWLAQEHGLSMLYPLWRGEDTIDVVVEGKSIAALVKGVADMFGLYVRLEHGLVVLSESPVTELTIYDVSDLIQNAQEDDDSDASDIAEELSGLLRSTVDPASWERSGRFGVYFWNGMFVVSQTHATQERIAAFLGSMRRALGR